MSYSSSRVFRQHNNQNRPRNSEKTSKTKEIARLQRLVSSISQENKELKRELTTVKKHANQTVKRQIGIGCGAYDLLFKEKNQLELLKRRCTCGGYSVVRKEAVEETEDEESDEETAPERAQN